MKTFSGDVREVRKIVCAKFLNVVWAGEQKPREECWKSAESDGESERFRGLYNITRNHRGRLDSVTGTEQNSHFVVVYYVIHFIIYEFYEANNGVERRKFTRRKNCLAKEVFMCQ